MNRVILMAGVMVVGVCSAQIATLHERALAMSATNQPPRLITNMVVFDPAPPGWVTNNVLYLGTQWGVVTQRIDLGLATNYVLGTHWSTNEPTPRSIAVTYQSTNSLESRQTNILNWGFPVTNYATAWLQVGPTAAGPFVDSVRVIQFTNVGRSGVSGPPEQFYRIRVWGWDTNSLGLELGDTGGPR